MQKWFKKDLFKRKLKTTHSIMARFYSATFLITIFLVYLGNISTSSNNLPDFPPKLILSGDQEFGTGHLQPLGYQCAPDGPVKEYNVSLRPEVFWQEHVKSSVPMVLRQGIGKSPALSTWTDDYLRETYGDLDLLIELKEEDRSQSTRRMNMADFLARYKDDDIYAVTVLPDPMRKEVQV